MKLGRLGYSLVETLIGASLTSLVVFNVHTFHGVLGKGFNDMKQLLAIQEVRRELLLNLTSSQAMKHTVDDAANVALECVRNGGPCGSGGYFRLRDVNNEIVNKVVDLSGGTNKSSNIGFDKENKHCQEFDSSSPNVRCPFQVKMSWSPICKNAACDQFLMAVNAEFSYESSKENRVILDKERIDIHIVMSPPISNTIEKIVVGSNENCAIYKSGRAKCWGRNDLGQVGVNSMDPVISTPAFLADAGGNPIEDISQIAAGVWTNCAFTITTGVVYCWGENTQGQLGTGQLPTKVNPFMTSPPPAHPTTDYLPYAAAVRNETDTGLLSGVVALSAGSNVFCGRLGNGNVYCWGDSWYSMVDSEFGNMTTDPYYDAYSIDFLKSDFWPPPAPLKDRKGYAHSLPHFIPSFSVGSANLPANSSGLYIGSWIYCTIVDLGGLGEVNCWGGDGGGQMGSEPANAEFSMLPSRRVPAVGVIRGSCDSGLGGNGADGFIDGKCNSTGTGEDLNLNLPAGNLQGVVELYAAYDHMCALMSDARVVCWGVNSDGQLGRGTITPSMAPWFALPEMVEPDPQYVLGPSGVGHLGGIVQVAGALFHMCARDSAGDVYCWGKNDSGGANPANASASVLIPEKVNLPGPAIDVGAGEGHSCALLATLEVYCWGTNSHGQLGVGDTNAYNSPQKVIGLGP